jgi:hypothetical protein
MPTSPFPPAHFGKLAQSAYSSDESLSQTNRNLSYYSGFHTSWHTSVVEIPVRDGQRAAIVAQPLRKMGPMKEPQELHYFFFAKRLQRSTTKTSVHVLVIVTSS